MGLRGVAERRFSRYTRTMDQDAAQLLLMALVLAGWWKIFAKAGEPGWKALIPVYNAYVFLRIAGCPGWWTILYFLPFVNFVIHGFHSHRLARCFGKGTGFAVGLFLLAPFFWPALGFGKAEYSRPEPASSGTPGI